MTEVFLAIATWTFGLLESTLKLINRCVAITRIAVSPWIAWEACSPRKEGEISIWFWKMNVWNSLPVRDLPANCTWMKASGFKQWCTVCLSVTEWLVSNVANWISISNTILRPPIELFCHYAFQFLGIPDTPSGNPVWGILLYAKAMFSNIYTTQRTLRVATVCGKTSSSARTRNLNLQTATICRQ